MGLRPAPSDEDKKRQVLNIQRPDSVVETRFDLPVTAMEFEIVDTIRNNDITIVCGETGSGKSTQVPAFLYEAGMSLSPDDPQSKFLIGITQPRRVAAVSTAKRVCYEMGQGDGQSIRGSFGKGNIVGYQTRYETAGLGDNTHIKFMTDGILLNEIQGDLLLRRYSVIVLDESHERNLNTDVLIGLLSVTVPLRKKAASENPSIVPLKLVLMSATLRVEDFTKNEKLFSSCPPAVVTVPGRTHPVTIHHSKVTELDDYETAAFKKVCKIHRKLPRGGILVFLTGKSEIVRMIKRLKHAFKIEGSARQVSCDVGEQHIDPATGSFPREVDDDEYDGDDLSTDDVDSLKSSLEDPTIPPSSDNDNIPLYACILPLYSLLSSEEQSKVFAPVPENHRLIVVATNIAETSITIPGISYVVDTGRQKCRNYNSGTGVASYDIMWISKAAADQRSGRAGRTGPGHCYRLYSSSLYSRHMDSFALPEVLTRPLEDVALSMKAMKISNISSFPFPTPPDRSQIDSAVKLLADIGCLDLSNVERDGGDGTITKLGLAVSELPLGVRYAKMLLVAAHSGVLDYAIVAVAALSESSPFSSHPSLESSEEKERLPNDEAEMDNVDSNLIKEREKLMKKKRKWFHSSGDLFAAISAIGAFTYAGRGAGGASEEHAARKFCEENGLNYTIMARIQKMRTHLAVLAKRRLGTAKGIAASSGCFSPKMSPPNKLQELLLIQSIASGLLDHIAVLAPPGSITGEHPADIRSAYIGCRSPADKPLFLDQGSSLFNRDYRQLPRWICYESVIRKMTKDGSYITVMKNITPIDPQWLGEISRDTRLITFGAVVGTPCPIYDPDKDAILCSVTTRYGSHGWLVSPVRVVMYDALAAPETKSTHDYLPDDSFRWFARYLWEGKVIPELANLAQLMNDSTELITRKTPSTKVVSLVGSLRDAGVDSAAALRKHWAQNDEKFLFQCLKCWVKPEHHATAKNMWINAVQQNVNIWKKNNC
ncbi:ATP-dependent helicase HrpA [Nitzschia inconspicua]|uniref:RNA helicase n=1 Tax=Nitzschia inconspicua TaxID=303405 RepID=A0A9K3L511_9STRA|nr:ATP-dependent helicase HrpA [Nitzschia inconspicua]